MGKRECAALERHEVFVEEDVGHNKPVQVPKENKEAWAVHSCRGCVIYLCILRTQCPCHNLGIQYTLIEFDLIKVVNDLD